MSTEEQKLGYGIASQARKNSRHIANKGWDHVGTYKDEGVSGSKEMGKRPDFDRLTEHAKLGGFDLVVVEKGDRIGRVGRAFWRWVWALEDMGIFVAITNRNIDNTTPEGRAQMRREADYAETEWENIRSRTQGGLQEKAEDPGSPHIGDRPPYGYRIEAKGVKGESRLVVDEAERAVVQRVHDMVVIEGLNLRQAAIRLNAEGITCRSGRPWSVANLRDRIMSRAVLDAELIFRGAHAKTDADGRPLWGESVTIALPRILSEDEAATLRQKVAARAKTSGRNRAVYPLTGRLIGLCKASYTGISRESSRTVVATIAAVARPTPCPAKGSATARTWTPRRWRSVSGRRSSPCSATRGSWRRWPPSGSACPTAIRRRTRSGSPDSTGRSTP
ncbi:recombinase family protein [Streptomyces sp. XY431]|uniref:recombinase family protein n=1 Tax=Streptomyces sp. XY431 TaxID=1415562 RepID=UPI001331C19F|nr:recombinase family protein [Streptomyces sp. XY431]